MTWCISVIAALALAGLAANLARAREQGRRLLRGVDYEARALCREAMELGEAICEWRDDRVSTDGAFLDRFSLSEPRVYMNSIPSLGSLPPSLVCGFIELHGHLAVARARYQTWKCGDQNPSSTYLLLSALLRAANGADGVFRDAAPRLGRNWTPLAPMAKASAFVAAVEEENPKLLDFAYWSPP